MFMRRAQQLETATMQMSTVGTATGFATGALASLAMGAADGVAQAIQASRIEAAFARWDVALRGEQIARRQAEQRAAVREAETKSLRAALARALAELKVLRAA
jgi:hypothetical protein